MRIGVRMASRVHRNIVDQFWVMGRRLRTFFDRPCVWVCAGFVSTPAQAGISQYGVEPDLEARFSCIAGCFVVVEPTASMRLGCVACSRVVRVAKKHASS